MAELVLDSLDRAGEVVPVCVLGDRRRPGCRL